MLVKLTICEMLTTQSNRSKGINALQRLMLIVAVTLMTSAICNAEFESLMPETVISEVTEHIQPVFPVEEAPQSEDSIPFETPAEAPAEESPVPEGAILEAPPSTTQIVEQPAPETAPVVVDPAQQVDPSQSHENQIINMEQPESSEPVPAESP